MDNQLASLKKKERVAATHIRNRHAQLQAAHTSDGVNVCAWGIVGRWGLEIKAGWPDYMQVL